MNLNLPGLNTEIAINTVRATRALGDMEGQFAAFTRRLSHLGVSMSFAVSIPIQIALTAAGKTFADLEDQVVRTTNRIQGATRQTSKDLQKFSVDLSRVIPQTAKEIEEAVDNVTRMGGNLDFAKKMTPSFTKFATVLGMDVTEATEETMRTFQSLGMVTGDLQGDMFGLQLLMDRMVQTFEVTGYKNHQMIEAFQNSSGVAQTFGMDIDSLTISLMMMSRAGKEGREAATSLNIVLRSLNSAQGRHKSDFSKVFGQDLTDNWNKLPWLERFQKMQDTLQKYSKPAQERIWKSIGIQPRQVSQIMPFLEHLSDIPEFTQKMKEAGVVQDRFNKILGDTKSQLKIMWNNFVAIGLAISEIVLPPLLKFGNVLVVVVAAIARFTNWIGNLPFGIGALASFLGKTTVFVTLIGLAVTGPLALLGSWFGRLALWFAAGSGGVISFTASLRTLFNLIATKGIASGLASIFGGLAGSVAGGAASAKSDLLSVGANVGIYGWLEKKALEKKMALGGFGANKAPSTLMGLLNALMWSPGRGKGGFSGFGIGQKLDTFVGGALTGLGSKLAPASLNQNIFPGSLTRRFVSKGDYFKDFLSKTLMGAGEGMANGGFFRMPLGDAVKNFGPFMRKQFSTAGEGAKQFYALLISLNYKELFSNIVNSVFKLGAAMKGMSAGGALGGFGMIKNFGSMVVGLIAAIPVWGLIVAGIMAAVSALSYFTRSLQTEAKKELDYKINPDLTRDSRGGFHLPKLDPIRLQALQEENKKGIGYDHPLGKNWMSGSVNEKNANMWRSQLEHVFSNPDYSIKGASATLLEAYQNHAILKDTYEQLKESLGERAKSGLTTIGNDIAGTADFEGGKKNARPMKYFSAKTLGSVEEYRERIMGQQQLVRVADTQLSTQKRTASNTKATAEGVNRIEKKLDQIKPPKKVNVSK